MTETKTTADLMQSKLTPEGKVVYMLLCTLFLECHVSRETAYAAMEALMHDATMELGDIKSAIGYNDVPMVPGPRQAQ